LAEEGAFVGLGASVRQGISLGEWSVVGAGATVVSNVEPKSVVGGTPAKLLRLNEDFPNLKSV
jgi:acetyltransferase-like isoleucine patch superfamily enzyme